MASNVSPAFKLTKKETADWWAEAEGNPVMEVL